jgi:hypothetical protein
LSMTMTIFVVNGRFMCLICGHSHDLRSAIGRKHAKFYRTGPSKARFVKGAALQVSFD